VLKREESLEEGKLRHTIYMRQVELGINKKNVLWIDESVFQTEGPVKKEIENVNKKNSTISFIIR
jgi:hypothetical protein